MKLKCIDTDAASWFLTAGKEYPVIMEHTHGELLIGVDIIDDELDLLSICIKKSSYGKFEVIP